MSTSQSPYCRCMYFSANALARTMTRLADEAFASTGLSPSHAYVLVSVVREPGIQPGQLAKMHQLTASTVTRLVDKLVGRGLLTRSNEGKQTFLWPSAEGQALEPAVQAAWKRLAKHYQTVLGREESDAFTANLAAVDDALSQEHVASG